MDTLDPSERGARQQFDMIRLLERVAHDAPEEFHKEAMRAADMVAALDADPEVAIQDAATRRFVTRMAEAGFVVDYYYGAVRPSRVVDAEACRTSLPAWLQPEFLQDQGIKLMPGNREGSDRAATEAAYQTFLGSQGLAQRAQNVFGAFYSQEGAAAPKVSPLWHKIYIEGSLLQHALENGTMGMVYAALAANGIQPYEMKLHDSDRLVFYFGPDVDMAAVEQTLSETQVAYRGPAQDVWQIFAGKDGEPRLESFESNDNAVGDRVPGWDQFNPHPYEPAALIEEYVRLCSKWGKSPIDPYRTSFIAARFGMTDPRLQDANFLARLNQMGAPYPVVVRSYPPNEHRMYRPAMPVIAR